MKVVSFSGNKTSLSERTGMCIQNKICTNLKSLVTTVNSVCISLWGPSLRIICSFLCSSVRKVKRKVLLYFNLHLKYIWRKIWSWLYSSLQVSGCHYTNRVIRWDRTVDLLNSVKYWLPHKPSVLEVPDSIRTVATDPKICCYRLTR